MKIFSIEKKRYVILWSFFFGFLANWLTNTVTKTTEECRVTDAGEFCPTVYHQGWPISVTLDTMKIYGDEGLPILINLIFWILVCLIILSIIRYFRYRNSK